MFVCTRHTRRDHALRFSLFVWHFREQRWNIKETDIVATITFRCARLCIARAHALALNGEKRFAKSSRNETPHLTRSSPQYIMCFVWVAFRAAEYWRHAQKGQWHTIELTAKLGPTQMPSPSRLSGVCI